MERPPNDRSAPLPPATTALAQDTVRPTSGPHAEHYPPDLGHARHLSPEELSKSLDAALRGWNGKQDLWLFAYGSLIWNPGVPVEENLHARVFGYHRGLYLWSRVNRGTPEHPGLVLALDRGGSCAGVALRLAAPTVRAHLETLWHREMALGSYRPAWLHCALADGRTTPALAFVMRRDVASYAGRLSDDMIRQVFTQAQGRYGTTHDYVARTVRALREAGMPDPALEAVLHRCGAPNMKTRGRL
ncbi:gamma-glutamylcyclotransferase [Pandoraea terrae]|uniref:glutathione-specific gamma-glutamylcyclotransferase n=1 Tax=Pandoraea terrae TaxID=1537710 RepID=A0A5E4Z5N2_9BURK|nr:gamma-glutamylcyclotransferase [Pandoraea terrae]VVE56048.1 gamma-glutamylcyclotransferase [Pandoraea terrae]